MCVGVSVCMKCVCVCEVCECICVCKVYKCVCAAGCPASAGTVWVCVGLCKCVCVWGVKCECVRVCVGAHSCCRDWVSLMGEGWGVPGRRSHAGLVPARSPLSGSPGQPPRHHLPAQRHLLDLRRSLRLGRLGVGGQEPASFSSPPTLGPPSPNPRWGSCRRHPSEESRNLLPGGWGAHMRPRVRPSCRGPRASARSSGHSLTRRHLLLPLRCEGCDSGCIPSPALLCNVQCVDSKVTDKAAGFRASREA